MCSCADPGPQHVLLIRLPHLCARPPEYHQSLRKERPLADTHTHTHTDASQRGPRRTPPASNQRGRISRTMSPLPRPASDGLSPAGTSSRRSPRCTPPGLPSSTTPRTAPPIALAPRPSQCPARGDGLSGGAAQAKSEQLRNLCEGLGRLVSSGGGPEVGQACGFNGRAACQRPSEANPVLHPKLRPPRGSGLETAPSSRQGRVQDRPRAGAGAKTFTGQNLSQDPTGANSPRVGQPWPK